jgi:hypothetical protein
MSRLDIGQIPRLGATKKITKRQSASQHSVKLRICLFSPNIAKAVRLKTPLDPLIVVALLTFASFFLAASVKKKPRPSSLTAGVRRGAPVA